MDIFKATRLGALREMLEKLVEGGADYRRVEKFGESILHIAAKAGNLEAISYLEGVEVDSKDICGGTPLMAAAALCPQGKFLAVADLFSKKGAKLNAQDNDGRNVLMVATEFQRPVETLEALVKRGAVTKTTRCSAIHVAAEVGYLEALQYFIRNGVDADWRDGEGATPLMFATMCKANFVAVAELLVAKAADPRATDWEGNSGLHWAAAEGNVEAVKFFLSKRVDVDGRNGGGWTPLMCATRAETNFVEVAILLIEKGADITAKTAHWKQSVVHLAAGVGNVEALRFLLQVGGSVHSFDETGATPFLLAVQRTQKNWAETVNILMEAGADVNDLDDFGNSAVHLALRGGKGVAEVKKLVEMDCCWWLPNVRGETVLKMASEMEKPDLLAYFLSLKTEENEEWFN